MASGKLELDAIEEDAASVVEEYEQDKEKQLIEAQIQFGISEIEKIGNIRCVDSFKNSPSHREKQKANEDPDDRVQDTELTMPENSTIEATNIINNTAEHISTDVLNQIRVEPTMPEERPDLSDSDPEDNTPYTELAKELD